MSEKLKITIEETNVLEGWQDVEGVNQEATCNAWAQAMAARLQQAYPEAEITATSNYRLFGQGKTIIDGASYDLEEAIKAEIELIADDLMNHSDDWTVKTAPTSAWYDVASPAERALIIDLCREAGENVSNERETVDGFLHNYQLETVRAAAAGDVSSLLELRRGCGLPITL